MVYGYGIRCIFSYNYDYWFFELRKEKTTTWDRRRKSEVTHEKMGQHPCYTDFEKSMEHQYFNLADKFEVNTEFQ